MWNRYGRFSVWYVAALGTILLLAGCSRADVRAVADLIPLQRQLESEYGASGTTFELLDGDTLGVTLVDSTSNGLTPEQKAELAREIAESVCQGYASMDRIERVRVAFESTNGGTLADATATVTFDFDRSELECGGG